MKKLIIVGAGGYAKSVLDSVDHMNFQMVGFLDDIKSKGEKHQGFPILGNTIDCIVNPEDYVYFVAIGNNAKRKIWFDKLKERKLSLINVIDKSALVSQAATIGEGSFIGKLAILNHGSSVGDNCVINTFRFYFFCRNPNYCSMRFNIFNDYSFRTNQSPCSYRQLAIYNSS